MLELQLELPEGRGRRAAIETALRDAIRSGRLTAGSALPSTRHLASDLRVSRSTVVSVYEQLTVEGFLLSEHGRGTTVAKSHVSLEPVDEPDLLGPTPRWDFRPGEPDNSSFPRRNWLRSVRTVLLGAPDDSFSYPDPRGRPELRAVLAQHVARTRSVITSPAGVIVCGGFAAGLGFVADMFRREGIERVAVEQAMLPFHRSILRLAGLEVDTIPVDDQGIDVAALADTSARAVVVTPANQYPFGVTLSPQRRTALVDWADSTNSWIVEDDYDGEFRYDRRPIGALQALAPHRVIYGGTTSKSLGAGLRLGWLVVPESLRGPMQMAANLRGMVSSIEQLALAEFIERGVFDAHIRQMRRRYQARRELLVDRLTEAAPWVDLHAPPAGLHLVASLPPSVTEADLLAVAATRDVGLLALQTHHRARSDQHAAIVGFSRAAEHEFSTALDRLCDTFAALN